MLIYVNTRHNNISDVSKTYYEYITNVRPLESEFILRLKVN